jgi:hypothetical protein
MADAIDPRTGDYISLTRGFDAVDGAILTAFSTVRGSGSAVENVGQRFADHTHVNPQLEPFMREEVRLATKLVVDRGDASIGAVAVTDLGDGAELYVEWKNLARDKARALILPPNLLAGAAP